MKRNIMSFCLLFITLFAVAQVWEKSPVGRTTPANIKETNTQAILSGKEFKAVFDKSTGILVSYIYKGKEFIKNGHGPQPFFWCKPANNTTESDIWKELSYVPLQATDFSVEVRGGFMREEDPDGEPGNRNGREIQIIRSVVSCCYKYPEVNGQWNVNYTVFGNGAIKVSSSFRAAKGNPLVPRIGMRMQIPSSYDYMKYYGLDSETNASAVVHKSSVKEICSSENDTHRTDVSWCTLTNKKGAGLLFIGQDTFELNVSNRTLEHLAGEKSKSKSLIDLFIDYRMGGVELPAQYDFTIVPLSKDDDLKDMIKQY